jgi:hypothetical protein
VDAESRNVDWRKLREFADVDLEHSFVLSWNFEAGTLLVDIDLLLLPDHPFYEPPRPAEKICIRPALIEFPFCMAAGVSGAVSGGDIGASVAGLGNGAISGLTLISDGNYEISGDFGTVKIEAERPLLRLKNPR